MHPSLDGSRRQLCRTIYLAVAVSSSPTHPSSWFCVVNLFGNGCRNSRHSDPSGLRDHGQRCKRTRAQAWPGHAQIREPKRAKRLVVRAGSLSSAGRRCQGRDGPGRGADRPVTLERWKCAVRAASAQRPRSQFFVVATWTAALSVTTRCASFRCQDVLMVYSGERIQQDLRCDPYVTWARTGDRGRSRAGSRPDINSDDDACRWHDGSNRSGYRILRHLTSRFVN